MGPLNTGITTAPMQPMPIMANGQLMPVQQNVGGNMTMSQPMIVPGGGCPAGPNVVLGTIASAQVPAGYPGSCSALGGRPNGQPGLVGQFGHNSNVVNGMPPEGCDPQIEEAQDFKPADDDPSRMYRVRQLDGHWVTMSRANIDGLGKAARWYTTTPTFYNNGGTFYAVRLDHN